VRNVHRHPQTIRNIMLILRHPQLIALATKGKEDFINKIMDFLRSEIEDVKKMDDLDLRKEIDNQILKANRYGFCLNSTVASYIISAFLMGENFDTDFKVATEILNEKTNEEVKCKKIEEWVFEIFTTLEDN